MLVVSLCMGWIVQLVRASFAWRTHIKISKNFIIVLSLIIMSRLRELTLGSLTLVQIKRYWAPRPTVMVTDHQWVSIPETSRE
jgi:hypothetical protein